ncbi:hypothetical protein AD940_15545 [Gluconobacter thailandicus]|uniref:Hint domain-containing protein n=1 Tax=Gluconobacter thailandicus TaxID=257438 RepID=UPI000777B021|nr:Hint domain-containing protein [Gluconobacter thailandicus]KXV32456.1 hypothetical protein AD940_15545 [Gluconobacter thailandicus]
MTNTTDWSSIPQKGGDLGTDGQETIVTGSPSTAVDSLTIHGTVDLNNNKTVEVQTLTLSSNSLLVINAGTNFKLNASTLPAGTIKMNGGSFTDTNAYGSAGPLVFDFGDPAANSSVSINAYNNTNVSFANVAPGDNITFLNSYGAVKLVDSGDGVITVTDSSGKTLSTLHTAKNPQGTYYKAADFSTSSSGNNSTLTCFLAGSMILTPTGEVAVESLEAGDNVIVNVAGREEIRPVTWAGRRSMMVRADLPADEAGYPVRILADAISPGVPHQDLLVTAEHCLFLDGKFIPARMLVNGRSIHYDLSITSYEYFHIETAEHSVITANGLLTESYLNTGNRGSFRQEGSVVSIGGVIKSWAEDAAAPLTTARETVEPVFHAIAARAEAIDVSENAQAVTLTDDADLHLVTEDGTILRKMRETNGYAMFMLPQNVRTVRLMSRTSRPADVIGPFVDDRRQLGVLVGSVVLYDAGSTTNLSAHLTEETLSGWSALESQTARWTTGNAEIQIKDRAAHSIAMLGVQILSNSQYIVSEAKIAAALTA